MLSTLVAGLLLGAPAAAAEPVATLEHRVRLDHAAGPVDAQYRSRVTLTHQQLGSAAPGGRPSTLRCAWRADLVVEREARPASGAVLQRALRREAAAEGSRPGWCSTQRAAIAREVAGRTRALQGELAALAEEDRDVLAAEIDRLHRGTGG